MDLREEINADIDCLVDLKDEAESVIHLNIRNLVEADLVSEFVGLARFVRKDDRQRSFL